MSRYPTEGIDPMPILHALSWHQVSNVQPILSASDSAVWRMTVDEHHFALRLLRAGEDDRARREAVAMDAARATGIPVPGIITAGHWSGRPAQILEWLPGVPLFEALLAAPERTEQLGYLLGSTQAQIHAIPASNLADLPPQSAVIAACGDPVIAKWLQESSPGPPMLLHGDYHPLNVLTDGQMITGVLDWANAAAADPRFDQARTCSIILATPLPELPATAANAFRQALMAGWVSGYQAAGGQFHEDPLFMTWAGLFMERDLAHKVNAAELAAIQQWTAIWRQRC